MKRKYAIDIPPRSPIEMSAGTGASASNTTSIATATSASVTTVIAGIRKFVKKSGTSPVTLRITTELLSRPDLSYVRNRKSANISLDTRGICE